MQPRPVIAGFDGSPESLAAVEWAAKEAERRGAPLQLLYAWSPVPFMPGAISPEAAEQRTIDGIVRRGVEHAEHTFPAVELETRTIERPPTAALVEAAEEAELLVLGSRGLSGFTGFLVGSVALGVVAHATGPVVLVRARPAEPQDAPRPDSDGSAQDRPPAQEVVLGLDVSAPCDQLIDFAFESALLRGARLQIVHAWGDTQARTLDPSGRSLIEAPQTEEQWTKFVTAVLRPWQEKYPSVPVARTLAKGKPAARLLSAAEGCDLLVVGRRRRERPFPGPQTGSVTHAVIHHARCPVAVVPHP
ncbi:universal stress protein [Streptomyces sp. TRM66268-LWL]|uniref:Universal stress protein n=1 Tax=Streptomyces polyasparticus TaxID=2767826 RepID=A0ABR7SIK3_9ACTN|nr:universal stress protein [Streptomyces polyasparticus]MBC9715325.1 universal stress protein [Streptomyces polyasparticus]